MPSNQKDGNQLLNLLNTFDKIQEISLSLPPHKSLPNLLEYTCGCLSASVAILWTANEARSKLKITETFGSVDSSYREIELDIRHPSVQYIAGKSEALTLSGISHLSHKRLAYLDAIQDRDWNSLMSMPLKIENDFVGILDVFFTEEKRLFRVVEKKLLKILANHISLVLQKMQALEEKEKIASDHQKLQELTSIMQEMTAASKMKEVWNLLRKGTQKLLERKSYIWIGRLNHQNGELKTVGKKESSNIKFGSGITGKALREEEPVIANNVMSDEWSQIYVRHRSDTQAEMSIPIVIDNVPIRQDSEVKLGSKRIGILNVESSSTNAFSITEQERLLLLARQAALRIERLELYNKLFAIREIEKAIGRAQDYAEIIKTVVHGIIEVLKFTWVNVSLIDSERTRIKSEHVFGLPDEQINKFKAMAVHTLECSDIQAEIVRTRQIKVPTDEDPALDADIFQEFDHTNLVRVFMPMVEPASNLVIGTVEAGYQKAYVPYIYEQDVQILRSFVDYAVHALERRKSGLIDRITHELKSPIVGISSNASFLQRRFSDVRLSQNRITLKLEDILTDCGLLLYQARQIEYFLGKSASQKPKYENIVVFRDIIIKTINQLKSVLMEYGFSARGIKYKPSDSSKIITYTDKVMLNQVVYNLLMNAIKYAEKDSSQFKVLLEIDENEQKVGGNFIIKFKDWGIGIKEEQRDKIFQEGFRALEAIKKVEGSGLGLNISKSIMQKLGGDLKLINLYKPTEFHLLLPKRTRGDVK